ncbi:DUF2975 domain-containing protein [Promicromonospora sp. NPDC023805]|uniref:DUF2975 domain-containing protein n=1 Tax=Promicromonospora sp. NPDC023805 TaxID=3154696 RepID=UPI0033E76735
MNVLATGLLRVVLVFMFLGVLLAQLWVLPDISGSLAAQYPEAAHIASPTLVTAILALVAAQLVLACVWRLLTLVRRDTVFSTEAFRWVDVIIGAAGGSGVLALGLLLWLSVQTTETGLQPGVALLLLGGAVLAGGIALLVGVLRSLLAKAVGLKGEATTLRAELDEVV